MKSDFAWPWLVFHFLQVGVFQFYAAPRLSQLGMILTKKRNPILAATITNDTSLHPPMWDYVIGIFSVAALVMGFILNEEITYRIGQYTSVVGLLMTCLIYDGWRYHLLKKLIPLQNVRRATLEPRGVGRTIPVWAWLLYLIFSVVFYIIPGELLFVQMTRAFAIIVFLVTAWFIDKRKPVTNNVQDDLAYRESESWAVFLVAWMIPIAGIFKQYLSSHIAEAAISAAPLVCFVVFLNSPIYRKLKS